jgi:hypothetical protein
MRVISLGWGVQSFALAAMVARGVLPPVDAAVHADTEHERRETYEFAEKWTPWLEERGVQIVTVLGGRRLFGLGNAEKSEVSIAAFTQWEDGSPSGTMRRQCTYEWKIAPIRRWLQANRNKQPVEQWLGITLDEITRIKPSNVKYITNRYPFIEMLDRPWTRGMAMRWLHDNGLEIPVKSSCIFCPYRDRATWREIQLSGNGDWEKALAVDRAIRHKHPGYLCYLTPERKPLDECDFRSQEEHGQLTLWDAEECSGMCFL